MSEELLKFNEHGQWTLEKSHVGFKVLEEKLSGQPGVTNPAGLAAKIGKEKYGKKSMEEHAAEGKKEHEVKKEDKRVVDGRTVNENYDGKNGGWC